jgi:hypothetical protein
VVSNGSLWPRRVTTSLLQGSSIRRIASGWFHRSMRRLQSGRWCEQLLPIRFGPDSVTCAMFAGDSHDARKSAPRCGAGWQHGLGAGHAE